MKLFWYMLLFLIGTFIYYLFNPTIEGLNISGQPEHQRLLNPSTGTYYYRSDTTISRPTLPAKELNTYNIESNIKGDLLVHINIWTPEKLTQEQEIKKYT